MSRVNQANISEEPFFTVLFNDDIWKELKRWMYFGKITSNFYNYRNGDLAIEYGYTGLIRESSQLIFSTHVIDNIIGAGHLETIEHFIKKGKIQCNEETIAKASRFGNIDVVKLIHYNGGYKHENNLFKYEQLGECARLQYLERHGPINNAVNRGNLEILKFLYFNGYTNHTQYVPYIAIVNGYLHIIEFLHQYSIGRFTTTDMDAAANYGHLEIVKFLHDYRFEGCTTLAMDKAAANGYLEIVKFLHDYRFEGCTKNAMNKAAENGYLEVVKFLYYNRSENCTQEAFELSFKYPEISKFLFFNRSLYEIIMNSTKRMAY